MRSRSWGLFPVTRPPSCRRADLRSATFNRWIIASGVVVLAREDDACRGREMAWWVWWRWGSCCVASRRGEMVVGERRPAD